MNDFWSCGSMRTVGMALGPIPLDKMVWYYHEFVDDGDRERWLSLMRRMDRLYLKLNSPSSSGSTADTETLKAGQVIKLGDA